MRKFGLYILIGVIVVFGLFLLNSLGFSLTPLLIIFLAGSLIFALLFFLAFANENKKYIWQCETCMNKINVTPLQNLKAKSFSAERKEFYCPSCGGNRIFTGERIEK